MRRTLLHEDAIKLSRGRIAEYLQSVQSWKNIIDWLPQTSQYRELHNIDGEKSRVRVEDFPRAHHAEATPGNPKHNGENSQSARMIQRSNHLHVDV